MAATESIRSLWIFPTEGSNVPLFIEVLPTFSQLPEQHRCARWEVGRSDCDLDDLAFKVEVHPLPELYDPAYVGRLPPERIPCF